MTKSTFSQIGIQLHLNTISKNANGASAFMGNFLCGEERVKRFVKVYLCCIVRNLNKDKRKSTLPRPWKNFYGRPWSWVLSCVILDNVLLGMFGKMAASS